jgi:hypothetical protein
MPAYRKKVDKLQEAVRATQDELVKGFVGKYQELLADKEAGRVLGKVVLNLAVTDKGLEYLYGEESRAFIEQTDEMLELGLAVKLGDKLLKACE